MEGNWYLPKVGQNGTDICLKLKVKLGKMWSKFGSGVLGTIFRGGIGISTNMHPYNVTLDKRGPKARFEHHRCVVCLGGSEGMPSRKMFEFRVSEMPFPGLWEGLTEI
jgi:hypothetical protein